MTVTVKLNNWAVEHWKCIPAEEAISSKEYEPALLTLIQWNIDHNPQTHSNIFAHTNAQFEQVM